MGMGGRGVFGVGGQGITSGKKGEETMLYHGAGQVVQVGYCTY